MEIIHMVLGKANPARMNGVNKVVHQLATRQAAAGKNVSLWGITPSPDHSYERRNFETRLFQAYRNPFRLDPAFVTALRSQKQDTMFHLHGGWIPIFFPIAHLLTAHNIPFVITPHGAYNTVARQRSGWKKRLYFRLFERRILAQAAKIHCIGESEVTGVREIFTTEKTYLLPYGFELSGALPAPAADPRTFIIGFVGRLDLHTKGIDLLLKAFASFLTQHPHARVWIVGDGPERGRLAQMIRDKNLHQHVVLWGSRFGADKDALMAQMDVFAHPSRNEGMPAAVLEAAAMGIPCVVSQATNLGSYIRQFNAGRVVENESASALVLAFQELAAMKKALQLTTLGENGKAMVARAFHWNDILVGFDNLYRC